MANKTLRDNEKQFYIYIMTNKYKRVLYVGVTSSLQERIYEHRTKMEPGFTSRYNLSKLVYYEELADSGRAIKREKQIKAGSRLDKINLIEKMNPEWKDLYEEL